jgi:hypothetical protein
VPHLERGDDVIEHMSRSRLRQRVGGRTLTMDGEAYLPGHGSPDVVAYRSSMTRWDDGTPVTPDDRARIEDDLARSAAERGLTIELEWSGRGGVSTPMDRLSQQGLRGAYTQQFTQRPQPGRRRSAVSCRARSGSRRRARSR